MFLVVADLKGYLSFGLYYIASIEYYLSLRKIIDTFLNEYMSAVIVPVSLAAGMAVMLAVSAPLLGNLSAVTLLAAEIALGALVYCALAWLFQREFVRAMVQLVPRR
jgi:hypothetical protein